jgi:polyisoprenyl-teichoic acid--peptidoglycan teichoic acid transferase
LRSNRWRTRASGSISQVIFTALLVMFFLTVAGATSVFVFGQVYDFTMKSEMLPDFTVNPESQPESEMITYESGKALPRWKGVDRVNVLVLGIDERAYEEGPWRTDTMLVLTIDPLSMTGGMLSIPRDLWVPIPGYEEDRINKAHFFGQVYDHPGGGPALSAQTVEYNFGVNIDYYVRVNFTAFEEMVDLLGGIDVYVEETIDDPTYPSSDPADPYGYDPLYIDAGWQHFDGEMALKYARTRHSEGGDFDRAARQQKVLLAVFNKARQPDELLRLASKSTEVWRTLQGSLMTDLNLEQIVALAQLASEVNPDDIRYGVLNEHYTRFVETPDGQQVLFLVRENMRELRDYIFTAELPASEESPESPEVVSESPVTPTRDAEVVIQVMNGTTREGLAGLTTDYLRVEGFQVITPTNADRSDYSESLVIVYTGKTDAAEYLVDLLALPPTAVVHGPDSNAQHDISLILGEDFQLPEVVAQ